MHICWETNQRDQQDFRQPQAAPQSCIAKLQTSTSSTLGYLRMHLPLNGTDFREGLSESLNTRKRQYLLVVFPTLVQSC